MCQHVKLKLFSVRRDLALLAAFFGLVSTSVFGVADLGGR